MNKIYTLLLLTIIIFTGFSVYKKITHKESIFKEPQILAPLRKK
ncbi:MAG: hypothetical protein AAB371_01700 [Patescibacteria group bacterium]